ncbi:MAG: hypothetical protein CMQ38_00325 [Gammaproteobacteria bacterium]|nr:hypothetical protein [Gammaproteobacteria bacterium]|tara:strand:- start:634 stop:1035 length:402 start_codon:yes stop_codon:yes gene_type:complete
MKNIFTICLTVLLLISFQSMAQDEDEKYFFPDLQGLEDFHSWQDLSWRVLDSKSLIVEASPAKTYLLILQREVPGLRSSNELAITSHNNQVRTGVDGVRVRDQGAVRSNISRIYLVPDRPARQHVIAQILGTE